MQPDKLTPRANYWTGRPLTYQELVSAANASGYVDKSPKEFRVSRKKTALEKKIEALTPQQAAVLADLASGKRTLVYLESTPYALHFVPGEGYHVTALEANAVERIVLNGHCTCPQHTKLSLKCKHIEAAEKLALPEA